MGMLGDMIFRGVLGRQVAWKDCRWLLITLLLQCLLRIFRLLVGLGL